jgi:quercetin dioxygenase-like cupin family protein
MIGRSSERVFAQVLPGIMQRTLATTDSLMLCEANFAAGSSAPTHHHDHEQITFIVSGRARVTIGNDVTELQAGDVYAIPGGADHSIEALVDLRVVDVFTPHRAEYALEQYVKLAG